MNTSKIETLKFDRGDTKAIKGAAVLLMIFHHLVGFPERFPVDFTGFGGWDPVTIMKLALNGKICISIFFFLGGYGLYKRWQKGGFSVTDTIINLYHSYWKVFVLFVPVALLLFSRLGNDINILCTRYVYPRGRDALSAVIAGFFGLSSDLNSEWWFLKSYILVIPFGYLFCCALKKCSNLWVELLSVFAFDLVLHHVVFLEATQQLMENIVYFDVPMGCHGYSSAYFAGIVFAKYDGICAIKRRLNKIPLPLLSSGLLFISLYWVKSFGTYENIDLLCCMLLIPALSVILDNIAPLKTIFSYLGKHSTNLWLIHSFYCYYFLEVTKVVYATTNVWIDLLILLALSLVSSIAVNLFWSMIGKVHLKIYATKLR